MSDRLALAIEDAGIERSKAEPVASSAWIDVILFAVIGALVVVISVAMFR